MLINLILILNESKQHSHHGALHGEHGGENLESTDFNHRALDIAPLSVLCDLRGE